MCLNNIMSKLIIMEDSRQEVSNVYQQYIQYLLRYGSCRIDIKCKSRINISEFFL